jgi:hypothetical protein
MQEGLMTVLTQFLASIQLQICLQDKRTNQSHTIALSSKIKYLSAREWQGYLTPITIDFMKNGI